MAKHDSLRKLARNKLLLEYRHAHPEASLREIGTVFNISPQRVWEIIDTYTKREGVIAHA